MTLFFDLDKVEQISKGKPLMTIKLLSNLYYKKLPLTINKARSITAPNLLGNSYLLNPEPLFKLNKTIDILYVIQYIKLASFRDYSLYKYYRSKTLQRSYYPDLNYEAVKSNPLLNITQTEIHFFYEELRN